MLPWAPAESISNMQFLIEFNGVTATQNEHITDFFGFVCEKLGIADHPVVTFSPDLGTTSFGLYHPASAGVCVAIEGRHISDILRTFAHELVHHKQLTSGSQLDLEGLEYEANAVAGMLMRDYNKLHPEMFGLHNHEDVPPEGFPESQGPVADDTTRPSQPVELAELSNKTLASYKRKAKSHLKFRKSRTPGVHDRHGYYGIEFLHKPNLGPKREAGIKTAESKLRKRYAPLKEDAPVNSAGAGNVDGIGIGPRGEPGIKKSTVLKRKKTFKQARKEFANTPKPRTESEETARKAFLSRIK